LLILAAFDLGQKIDGVFSLAGGRAHGPGANALTVVRGQHAHLDLVDQLPNAGEAVFVIGANRVADWVANWVANRTLSIARTPSLAATSGRRERPDRPCQNVDVGKTGLSWGHNARRGAQV
jgi:hypothetical protein